MKHILYLILIATAVAPASFAHDPADSLDNDSLITEIRLLREELRRMATTNIRATVLVEQVRIQSELVRRLAQDVDQRNMSRVYEEMEMEAGWADDYEKDLERRLTTATGEERTQIERELQQIERRVEMQERRKMQENTRSMEMERRLDEATARLDELFAEIDKLGKGLE